jgi:hypothetical protein
LVAIFVSELYPAMTNEDLVNVMRAMKAAREAGVQNVVCVIGGFDTDERELFQIQEARAFCRRVTNTGLISYLDAGTGLPGCSPETAFGWGAMEVWMCGENRIKSKSFEIDEETLNDLEKALFEANAKADNTLGPMTV